MKFDNFIARTGYNRSFVADRAITIYIDNRFPVNREDDARYRSYMGEKKTEIREVSVSDVVDAILEIESKKHKVSRSSFAAQAILAYIDSN